MKYCQPLNIVGRRRTHPLGHNTPTVGPEGLQILLRRRIARGPPELVLQKGTC